jgi:tetratricopeptide (TPR) repeat protein
MRGKMKKLIILLLCLLPYALTCQEKQTKDSPGKETATESIPGWMKKAEDLAHQGNIPEASALYIRIMKLEPHNKQAVQGWLMANMKRSPTGEQEAIQSLEELGKTYPENSAILFWKLFLHAEYGHNEEALRLAEALIALQPDSGIN